MNRDRVTLDELDMDTLKTTAKAMGNRVKDAATATAGSFVGRGGEAQGRLGVRIAADHMLQGWLKYKGATGAQGTRDDLYRFISKHYGNIIDDSTLRNITGMSAAPPPLATGPTASAQQQPPLATGPTASPIPRRSTPGAASKQGAPAAQWQKNPNTGVQYRSVTSPATAPAPPGAQNWQPPDNPQPQVGAQPAAPTGGTSASVPFMITNAQKQSLRAAGFTDEQITNMTPEQAQQNLAGNASAAPAAPAAPAPPAAPAAPAAPASPAAPAAPAPAAGVDWKEFHNQLEQLIKQPQTDGPAVMHLLDSTLKQTQKGSPDRAKLVNLLHAFQSNPMLAAKVPEIKTIFSRESHRRRGTLLREADDDVLARSALDQIFVKTAQTLVASGKLPNENQQTGGPRQQSGAAETLDTYLDKQITRVAWDRATNKGANINPQHKTYQTISNKLDELWKTAGKRVTLRDLKVALGKRFFDHLHNEPDVEKALLQAAKAGT